MTERRTARRYDLSLPVIIRIPAERQDDSQEGKTRDISTRGLYFVIGVMFLYLVGREIGHGPEAAHG